MKTNDYYQCNLCENYLEFEGARIGYGIHIPSDFPIPEDQWRLSDLRQQRRHLCRVCIDGITKIGQLLKERGL